MFPFTLLGVDDIFNTNPETSHHDLLGGLHQKSKTEVTVAQQKDLCPPFFKKRNILQLLMTNVICRDGFGTYQGY